MAVSLPGWCPGGPYRAGAATSAVATVAPSAEAILAGRLPAGHPHVEAARDAPDHRRSRS